MKRSRIVIAAVMLNALAAVPVTASAQTVPLLDVPYVAQSEDLCGGAAAAMVMRYWGATGIYPESFASLIDSTARGIRGSDLVHALQERGWRASSTIGDAAMFAALLEQRVPPIALIEVRPGRFHYVVVVGWTADAVIIHDPARNPFRVLTRAAFMTAWARSGHWTLVVLPGEASPGPIRSSGPLPPFRDEASTAATGLCGDLVATGVADAAAGDLDSASRLLNEALERCPHSAAAWRERAGLHALRREWPQAADAARKALEREPRDEHAARILATGLYLEGDPGGALEAWNRAGEPVVGLVEIHGLERTRFVIASGATGLEPGELLSAQALQRASRRLAALPAAATTRVSYTPTAGGVARVEGVVLERPLVPSSPIALAGVIVRAAVEREARMTAASVGGGGELWQVSWRFTPAAPRVLFSLEAPAGFGGVWGLTASNEREMHGPGTQRSRSERRLVSVHLSDWATHAVRWRVAGSLERWSSGTVVGGVSGAIAYHSVSDRATATASVSAWTGQTRTWSGSVDLRWRSRPRETATVWLANAGAATIGGSAPFLLWPGAGTGMVRGPLLRAHPLVQDDAVHRGVLARHLLHGSAEWRRWSRPVRHVLRFGPAVFLDAARGFSGPAWADRRAHLDVGFGLRMALPALGVIRADVARGLRDGNTALSFGWSH